MLLKENHKTRSDALRDALMRFQMPETKPALEAVVPGFIKWASTKLNETEYKKLHEIMAKYGVDVVDAFRMAVSALPN